MKKRPHALLVGYGGGHISMLLPVAEALKKRDWIVTILALTTARSKAIKAGFSPIGFHDLLEYGPPNSLSAGAKLLESMPRGGGGGGVSEDETLAYHGINFAELIDTHGLDSAQSLFADNGRQAFLPVKFMERVLKQYRPDIVVTTNSPRSERATVLAAEKLNIPTICLVDMFVQHAIEWLARPDYANKVCVLNQAVRKSILDKSTRSADDIVVTGNPAFDSIIADKTRADGLSLRKSSDWDDGRLTILWASQQEPYRHPFTGASGNPKLPQRIEDVLRKCTANDDGLRLVIRHHPSEQKTFTPSPRVHFSPPEQPLHNLLHAVDAVVVMTSTVGLEAWLAQKPVLNVLGSVFSPDVPFEKVGIAHGISSPEILQEYLTHRSSDAFSFPLPGQSRPTPLQQSATEAVVQEIEELSRSAL